MTKKNSESGALTGGWSRLCQALRRWSRALVGAREAPKLAEPNLLNAASRVENDETQSRTARIYIFPSRRDAESASSEELSHPAADDASASFAAQVDHSSGRFSSEEFLRSATGESRFGWRGGLVIAGATLGLVLAAGNLLRVEMGFPLMSMPFIQSWLASAITASRTRALDNGSFVVVNADTRLGLNVDGDPRHVRVDAGRATFDLAASAEQPCLVSSPLLNARAEVDSKFTMSVAVDATSILVHDGEISIFIPGTTASRRLTRGESHTVKPERRGGAIMAAIAADDRLPRQSTRRWAGDEGMMRVSAARLPVLRPQTPRGAGRYEMVEQLRRRA